ncbi:hypothetical protein JN531_017090 (plasmid) [Flagellatimonas centrodinii]|uniref:hypothetical protein n=1 Tax=Flagellatimonas centrodinii TaxID=2806210 RepID=UPI001FEE7098|nr:hypothetical protein [Flagellatimonas centrodinii]ULQ48349.1 hypothetical protein JN531_017090 [Flagellatimonas centrodinii]
MNNNSHDLVSTAGPSNSNSASPSKEKIEIYVNSSVTRVLALKLRELDRLFTSADRALGGGQLSVETYMNLTGSSAAMIKTMDSLAAEYRSHGGIKAAHDQLTGRRRASNWKKPARPAPQGASKAKGKDKAGSGTDAEATPPKVVDAPEAKAAVPDVPSPADAAPPVATPSKDKPSTAAKTTKASTKAPDVAV